MSISTHVLDTSKGRPAADLRVVLETTSSEGGWDLVGAAATDDDGRAPDLVDDETTIEPGMYRLTFDTGDWFAQQGVAGFYPEVQILFEVTDANRHHHVPLLLSPFGYSTYRGS